MDGWIDLIVNSGNFMLIKGYGAAGMGMGPVVHRLPLQVHVGGGGGGPSIHNREWGKGHSSDSAGPELTCV